MVPVNAVARSQLGEDPLLKEIFLLDQADVANMLRIDFTKLDLDDITRKWTRAVAK